MTCRGVRLPDSKGSGWGNGPLDHCQLIPGGIVADDIHEAADEKESPASDSRQVGRVDGTVQQRGVEPRPLVANAVRRALSVELGVDVDVTFPVGTGLTTPGREAEEDPLILLAQ